MSEESQKKEKPEELIEKQIEETAQSLPAKTNSSTDDAEFARKQIVRLDFQ